MARRDLENKSLPGAAAARICGYTVSRRRRPVRCLRGHAAPSSRGRRATSSRSVWPATNRADLVSPPGWQPHRSGRTALIPNADGEARKTDATAAPSSFGPPMRRHRSRHRDLGLERLRLDRAGVSRGGLASDFGPDGVHRNRGDCFHRSVGRRKPERGVRDETSDGIRLARPDRGLRIDGTRPEVRGRAPPGPDERVSPALPGSTPKRPPREASPTGSYSTGLGDPLRSTRG